MAKLLLPLFSTAGTGGPAAAAEEEEPAEEVPDVELMAPEAEPLPPMPEAGADDWEGAAEHKSAAAEVKSSGDHAGVVAALSAALACQPSALAFANRADSFLALRRRRRPWPTARLRSRSTRTRPGAQNQGQRSAVPRAVGGGQPGPGQGHATRLPTRTWRPW